MKQIALIGLMAALSGASYPASITLTFEGLGDLERVQNFYNAGLGGSGSGPGSNFGITFNADALAIIDQDAGGSGNVGGEPSPNTVLFFLTGSAAVMTMASGFDTGFSFFYSAINQPGSVTVWDGVNGTGNILATLNLPLTPHTGAPDPTGQFSPFIPIGVGFSGTARSISFAGVIDQIAFDNITFGSVTPGGAVPEPSTNALLSAGLAVIAWRHRRRG